VPQLDPNTETDIANAALSSIKAGRLLSLDADNTDKAIIVRKFFAKTRDALQRKYKWNFNEAYLSLPAAGDAPAFGYIRRFPWAPEILRVREVPGCHRRHWRVQGRSILANAAAPLRVVASVRIADVSQWDALFKTAMIAALAYAIAPEAAKDDDTIERAKNAAKEALAEATPVDADEGTPDEPEEQDVILSRC
jgi:hypothetical protein